MKLWKKRVLSGLLAGVMALWMMGAALAAPETGSPSQARSGVARVVALYEMDVYTEKGGDYVATIQGAQQGSAFGVGTVGEETDVFVTNRHVVTLEEEKGDLQLEGYTLYQESTITGYYILLDNFAYNTETFTLDTSRSIPCTVVYLGEKDDEDVAVLRAAETVPGRTALALQADESTLEVGDGVTALGFPAISDSATSEGYLLATVDDMTLTNGVVSRFFDSVSATASDGLLSGRLIQSTAAINGGNSGGPLVDETGAVVGINTYTVSSQDSSVTSAYYLASGYAAVDNSGDTVYQYKVVPAGQNPAQVVTGDADISVSDSITNADEKALAEEVADALSSDKEPDIGEALKAAAGTVANQNTVTKEQGKDALTNAGVSVPDTSNVTIVVQPYLEVSVANVSIQGSTKAVTLDITPMYITVATTNKDNIDLEGSDKNAVQIGTAHELTITKPVTVTIPLTTGFVNDGTLYVKHVKDNGSTYYYKGSVKDNVLTFTNPNGFSLFTYSTSSDEVVAAIGDHGYATLADAIAAVEKGGTIELLADNLSATVSREISFTVTGNGADTVRLSAGSGYKMQQVGNTYTFTYIGTEGGGSSTSGYLVSVDSGKNGKVTVSPQRAEKGETVTITVKPDEGYELDELTVTDKNGDSVKVTYKDDNKYTFKMPGSSVTVEATFQAVKEESPVDAFLDINTGAWYYDAVKYVVENGLMSGTGTYTFEPNTTLSRGMIAQMLYALEGKPSVSATNSFTDVSANDWYAKAASWAQSKGIITGYDDGRFAPNDPLTREQLALILYNYAQSKGYDTSAKADLSKYVDGSSTSAWAQTAMTWAVGEGLLSGRGLNMLYPTGTATRAEVAQIMMNFCENTAK